MVLGLRKLRVEGGRRVPSDLAAHGGLQLVWWQQWRSGARRGPRPPASA